MILDTLPRLIYLTLLLLLAGLFTVILPCLRVRITRLSLAVILVQTALAQAPQITSAGVVNAASYAQPIAPGSLVSIFGMNLATASTSAVGQPLPIQLSGTSVAVNGVQAPLLFVSPTQINLEIPSATTFCYVCSDFDSTPFVVTTARQVRALQCKFPWPWVPQRCSQSMEADADRRLP